MKCRITSAAKAADVCTSTLGMVIMTSRFCDWLATFRRRRPNSLMYSTNSACTDSKDLMAPLSPGVIAERGAGRRSLCRAGHALLQDGSARWLCCVRQCAAGDLTCTSLWKPVHANCARPAASCGWALFAVMALRHWCAWRVSVYYRSDEFAHA